MELLSNEWIMEKLLFLPGGLLGLTLHEFAHARTALAFGDPTAHYQGRVTLNPLAHLDPMGTLCLLFVGFGWARPVPVDNSRLHPPMWGDIAVSLAGVCSNLLLAILSAAAAMLLMYLRTPLQSDYGKLLFQVLFVSMMVNLVLMTFNLIPLFPLDGHHVIRELLPRNKRYDFMRWQMQYGRFALMGLIILPRILSGAGQRDLPVWADPVGWLIGHVFGAAMTAFQHVAEWLEILPA
ncbi:MAG: site-2 protease family protein [Phycisphaerae bacterium]